VRGDISRRYLRHLGFPEDRIDVIGCPSLFTWGPDFRMTEREVRLRGRSKISLSFDHRIPGTAGLLQATLEDYRRSTVYMQEQRGAQMVITGEETRPDWEGDARFPMKTTHPAFAEHRLVYFPTAWSWIRHLKGMDFAFGPRLHGTVAAILAGTPANLLVHDSRTLEVAEHHHLPHIPTEDLGDVRTAADLAGRQDPTAFNASYPELFARFTRFLKRNELRSAYEAPGAALRAFDASLATPGRAAGVFSAQSAPSGLRERVAMRLGSGPVGVPGRQAAMRG
jgi:hypothetical protein